MNYSTLLETKITILLGGLQSHRSASSSQTFFWIEPNENSLSYFGHSDWNYVKRLLGWRGQRPATLLRKKGPGCKQSFRRNTQAPRRGKWLCRLRRYPSKPVSVDCVCPFSRSNKPWKSSGSIPDIERRKSLLDQCLQCADNEIGYRSPRD